jgi:tight adherence protein B
MLLILVLVFVAVFVVAILIMTALGKGPSQQPKRTLATLDAALTTSARDKDDQVLDIQRKDLMSAIPMLNRWLMTLAIAPRIRKLLTQADLTWTVGGLLLAVVACGSFSSYGVYLRTGAAPLSLLLGAVAASLPVVFVLRKRTQRFEKFEQHLPDALDVIVGALRAGHSLISALSIVARETPEPIKREFRLCFDEQNFGVEFRVALLNLVERVPIQDLRIVVTAILIQKESGGNLAEVLEKVASVVRERYRLKRKIQTHTAQGRLTGWILSALPLVLAIAMYLINPGHMSLLWTRPEGIKMLYASVGMTCIGGLIIRSIIRIRV